MLLTLHLSTANTTFTLAKPLFNQIFNSIALLKANVQTNSSTRTAYYLRIVGLYNDEIVSNINSKAMIPLFVGQDTVSISLTLLNHSIGNVYQYEICDETGNATTDTVSMDLVFVLSA